MPERYRRFSWSQRVEHWVQLAAFVGLATTGLPQRYDGAWLSDRLIEGLGGIETVRIIHRVFASVLIVAVVYHFIAIGYRKYVLREPRTMVPGRGDLKAIGQSLAYVVGLRGQGPRQGRYTWQEKVEYWALIWGTVMMVITGFFLWNPVATAAILPGEFIPAALKAHSFEALLAVLAVLVWHVYHVHLRKLNKSIYGGYLTREEMEEEHPLELEAIERGDYSPPPNEEMRQRARRYLPVAAVAAAALLTGLYFFTTFENTAITTVPPSDEPEVLPSSEASSAAHPSIAIAVPAAAASTGSGQAAGAGGSALVFGQRGSQWHGGVLPAAGLSFPFCGALAANVARQPGAWPSVGEPGLADVGTGVVTPGG
jgi:formate dehydrogenase gamma subunit